MASSITDRNSSFPPAETNTSLREFLFIFHRRKTLIAGIILTGLFLTLLVLVLAPPRYTAQALVLINGGVSQELFKNHDSLKPYMRPDLSLALNEIEIIRSRTLTRKIADKLDLKADPEYRDYKNEDEIVTEFLDRLDVRAHKGSLAIVIGYKGGDARKTALVVNTLAKTYLEQRLNDKFDAARKRSGWLDRRLGELREQAGKAETAVQDFRARIIS